MANLQAFQVDVGLSRLSLASQAVTKLRSHIISGIIPPGTPLVERDLAELLGISRGPAREALMELESQGLVANVRGRRRVIDPSTEEIVEMLDVRAPLEIRAAERAAANVNAAGAADLHTVLEIMLSAVEERDQPAFVLADLRLHEKVWEQSGNVYLARVLRNMSGPIFLAIVNGSFSGFDWNQTLELHRDLVQTIASGDVERAAEAARRNMAQSLERNQARGADSAATNLPAP